MEKIEDIKTIQNIALKILIYIDEICRKNNIKYTLAGGTMLGAVRHKGFIPWDDDIDIAMPREDYEKFLKIMDEDSKTNTQFKCLHFGENFPNYFYRFAKVVDLSTHLTESTCITNPDMGIFVDVFPADGIPVKRQKHILEKSKFYAHMLTWSASKSIPIKVKSYKRFFRMCITPFAKLFGWKYWWKKHENFVRKYKMNDFEYSVLYSGAWGEKEIFPTKFFDNLIELEFENHKFYAFKEYDKHLTHMYGDYMQLPPVEKRVTHHDFQIYKK